MTDLNKLADELQPGIRWAQSKLQEISDYLDAMGPTLRNKAQWHPIDTLPPDKMVLAYCDGYFGVIVRTKKQKFAAPWTHWMELPEKPNA